MTIGDAYHQHIRVVIPSIDRHGQPLDPTTRSVIADKILTALSDWAGGYINTAATGGWINPAGHPIEETVSVVEAYGKTPPPDALLNDITNLILNGLDQEAAAIAINGVLYLCAYCVTGTSPPNNTNTDQ